MWKIRNECVTETVEAIRSWSSRSRNWSRIAECQFGHNTLRFVWCSNRKMIWTITFLSYNDCREVFYSNKRSNVQIYIRKTLATFCERVWYCKLLREHYYWFCTSTHTAEGGVLLHAHQENGIIYLFFVLIVYIFSVLMDDFTMIHWGFHFFNTCNIHVYVRIFFLSVKNFMSLQINASFTRGWCVILF